MYGQHSFNEQNNGKQKLKETDLRWSKNSFFSYNTVTIKWDTCKEFISHGGLVAKSCLTLATPWTVACQALLSMNLQARILELVAISFSRGSPPPRDWTRVSCIAGRFLTDSCSLVLITVLTKISNICSNLCYPLMNHPLFSLGNPFLGFIST